MGITRPTRTNSFTPRCPPHGTLVSYAIIAAVSGTGGLWPPFLKAVGQALLWSAQGYPGS